LQSALQRRLSEVLDLHADSLTAFQQAAAAHLGAASAPPEPPPASGDVFGTRPHLITRRTAEFVAALLRLAAVLVATDRSRLRGKLATLQGAYLTWLFQASKTNPTPELVHVANINNLDLFISILRENEISD